jgi:hypothetical protein
VEASTDVTVAPEESVVVRVTEVTISEELRALEELPPLAWLLKELDSDEEREEIEDDALARDEVSVRVAALEASEARDEEMDEAAEEMDEETDEAELLAEELSPEELALEELPVEDGSTALVAEEAISEPIEETDERIWPCRLLATSQADWKLEFYTEVAEARANTMMFLNCIFTVSCLSLRWIFESSDCG